MREQKIGWKYWPMGKLTTYLLLLLFGGGAYGCSAAPDAIESGRMKEMRGVWIASWEWSRGMLTPDEVDRSVALAKRANINALFVEVRKAGDAYYRSDYEPRAEQLKPVGDEWDPLEYIIQKAHAEGIEVHAWLVAFRVWKGKNKPVDPSHPFNKYPQWLNKQVTGETFHEEGYYLDPAIPEVRDHTVNVYLDVVKKYNIDGIHFDYIRYPGMDWGYSDLGLREFQRVTGRKGKPKPEDAQFSRFRRDAVTDVVKRIYNGCREINPKVKVTAAVICWGNPPADFRSSAAYKRVFQDWRGWARDGILDAIIPMNYSQEKDAGGPARWRGWVQKMNVWKFDRHAYTGYWFQQSPGEIIRQLTAAREMKVDGAVGFAFHESPAREKVAEELSKSFYLEPADTPRMSWKGL